MKIKAKVAGAIMKISVCVAKQAAGSASVFGFYQPKEPKFPKVKK